MPVLQGLATDCPVEVDMASTKRRWPTTPTGGGCGRGRTTRWAGCRGGPMARVSPGRSTRCSGPAGGGGRVAAGRDDRRRAPSPNSLR